MDQPLPGLPPQHPLCFALNFALENQRETLATICQLTHELTSISLIAEPQVAAVKVPWWRDELDRWNRHEARHPATRKLQHLGEQESVVNAVLQLFTANIRQLTSPRFGADAEFWQHCEEHGMGMGVIAAYLGVEDPTVLAGYTAVGSGITAIERLLNVTADARAGRILLPLDRVAAAGLDTDKLAGPDPGASFAELRRSLASNAAQRMGTGVQQIRTEVPLADHRYVLVASALYDMRAAALSGPHPNLSGPGPLKQLWTAWQTARRAR